MAGVLSVSIVGQASAYSVKSGDTMGAIAKSHNLTLQQLASLNPDITNLDIINIGQNVNTTLTEQPVITAYKVTESDKELMARLVRAEAVGEPFAGKVAVAVVVLNRVAHEGFPNTVKEVIYQKGQFTPVSNGQINQPADADSIRAVEEAITYGKGNGSIFFYNPKTSTNQWIFTRETITQIGNHVFAK